ncbi:hypothetical protein J3R83DRAFT_1456 [Lanmaoa asiatica]|nr:hypothetical protein J3R83DRAFT_1456 [Lanmaoa asiatica]
MTIDQFKTRIIELDLLSYSSSEADIDVYKVPENKLVPDDDSMEAILGTLSISMLGTPLRASRLLSDYFKPPIPQHQLHFVIDVPSLDILCWPRGTDDEAYLLVKALKFDRVDSFKNVIKTELHVTHTDVPSPFLKLYMIPAMDDVNLPKILGAVGAGQLLRANQLLGTVFNDVPFSANPRVVIEWLDDGLVRKRKKDDHEEATYGMVELVKRAKFATDAPSAISRPQSFKTLCKDREKPILHCRHPYSETLSDPESSGNGPPYDDDDLPPISLQYEGFGHFLDIFHGREDVPGMENVSSATLISAVDDFADLMSHVFATEAVRRGKGLAALNVIFLARTDNISFQFMPPAVSNNSASDGHILGPHHIAYCITEFKNEPGDVTSIPYVQMASYFAHSIREASERPASMMVMNGWNLPCLGLTIVGHYVTFYAMIFFGQWRIVSLTPALSCTRDSGQGADRLALYAAFTAASVLLARIREDAARLVFEHLPEIQGSRILPCISSLARPHSSTRIKFKILFRIFRDKAIDRQLYLSRTNDNKDILVKFSSRYSFDLHTFCANRGCAPALLGFEKLPGGFFGIAMEFVESACQITQSPYVEKHREWMKQLRELVQSFHDQNLVHGDLRGPNIICDGNRIMIIDFDWAGTMGEVSYPICQLNPDLTDGRDSLDRKITKADDLRVLDRTLKSVPLDSVMALC